MSFGLLKARNYFRCISATLVKKRGRSRCNRRSSHSTLPWPGWGGVVRPFLNIWQILESWPPPFGPPGHRAEGGLMLCLLRPLQVLCATQVTRWPGLRLQCRGHASDQCVSRWWRVEEAQGPKGNARLPRSGEQSCLPSMASTHLCPSPGLTFPGQ